MLSGWSQQRGVRTALRSFSWHSTGRRVTNIGNNRCRRKVTSIGKEENIRFVLLTPLKTIYPASPDDTTCLISVTGLAETSWDMPDRSASTIYQSVYFISQTTSILYPYSLGTTNTRIFYINNCMSATLYPIFTTNLLLII